MGTYDISSKEEETKKDENYRLCLSWEVRKQRIKEWIRENGSKQIISIN